MKKLFFLLSFLLMVIVSQSQDIKFVVQEKLNVGLDMIKDFKYVNNQYLFLNKSTLKTMDMKGNELNSKSVEGVNGFDWSDGKIQTISSKNNINSNTKYSDKYSLEMKFLSPYEDGYFTCKVITAGNSVSYSSAIVFVDNSGNEKIFDYIEGVPSGLFEKDGKLYYVLSKNVKGENGFLKVYDIMTKSNAGIEEIPVVDPVGISIDTEGNFYSYSSFTNEIIKFRRK
ncbi:MAG: hypothetical protein V2A54_16365 [Bacteroidota bacterium]